MNPAQLAIDKRLVSRQRVALEDNNIIVPAPYAFLVQEACCATQGAMTNRHMTWHMCRTLWRVRVTTCCGKRCLGGEAQHRLDICKDPDRLKGLTMSVQSRSGATEPGHA